MLCSHHLFPCFNKTSVSKWKIVFTIRIWDKEHTLQFKSKKLITSLGSEVHITRTVLQSEEEETEQRTVLEIFNLQTLITKSWKASKYQWTYFHKSIRQRPISNFKYSTKLSSQHYSCWFPSTPSLPPSPRCLWHSFLFSFFLWPRRTACGILVPRPVIKPMAPALEACRLNHWTAREVPMASFSFGKLHIF